MLLRRIVLHDFRQFHGHHAIDLRIDLGSDRNLVLIGGLNGSGKTTLLEGLQLALFGPDCQGLWERGVGYYDFIQGSINRDRYTDGERGFMLAVELEAESLWGSSVMRMEREWQVHFDGTVEHQLRLYEDGSKVQGDPGDWEDLIRQHIPLGVAPFFFFDGEKIQEFASDEANEERLAEAIKRLLNVQIYEVLETDLIAYEKNLQRSAIKDDSQVHEALQRLEEIKTEMHELAERVHEHETGIIAQERRARELEQWIMRQGSRQALDRIKLQTELNAVRQRKENVQKQLAEFVGQTLPSALLAPLMRRLEAQLYVEEELERDAILRSTLTGRYDRFLSAIAHLDDQVKDEVAAAWSEAVVPVHQEVPIQQRLHDNLNSEQRRVLLARLAAMQQAAQGQIGELVDQLDTVERELRRLTMETKQIPEDPEFIGKEQERRECYEAQGRLKKEIELLEVRRRELVNAERTLSRQLQDLEEKAELASRNRRKLEHSCKVRGTLRSYMDQLTGQKLHQVAYHLTEMFQRLHRKVDFVDTFQIDPKTFRVTLKTRDGQLVEKRQLSAGEKEIYALALLWALSKASQKDLPIVIDTPLGRLDSVHRSHIAGHYLPEANRQVVLLSTDTEFDEELFNTIKPHVAKSYTILYDKATRRSSVEPGYFFGGTHGRTLSVK